MTTKSNWFKDNIAITLVVAGLFGVTSVGSLLQTISDIHEDLLNLKKIKGIDIKLAKLEELHISKDENDSLRALLRSFKFRITKLETQVDTLGKEEYVNQVDIQYLFNMSYSEKHDQDKIERFLQPMGYVPEETTVHAEPIEND